MNSIYYVIKRNKDNTYFAGQGTFSNGFHGAIIYKSSDQAKKTCLRYSTKWKENFEIVPIKIKVLCTDHEEIKFEPDKRIRFTPEQVRKMSPLEVKLNYKAILESMKYWN